MPRQISATAGQNNIGRAASPRRSCVALLGSLAEGLGTPGLRRLQLAWGASALGAWVFFVALATYAYFQLMHDAKPEGNRNSVAETEPVCLQAKDPN